MFFYENIFYFLKNNFFVFALENNNDNLNTVNHVKDLNNFFDKWPFTKLKPKIENAIDSFLTEEFFLFLFLFLIFVFCSFFIYLNKYFGYILTFISLITFYFLNKLWEKTNSGEVFLNLFDKIILIKPLTFSDKKKILNSLFEKYSIPTDILSENEIKNLFESDSFINLSKNDFILKIDNYILSNLSNEIQSIADFSFDEKLKFLFFESGNKLFSFSSFLWDNKISLFLLFGTISTLVLFHQGFTFHSLIKGFISFFSWRENNDVILAQSNVDIVRNNGEALVSLDLRINGLHQNLEKVRDSLVECMQQNNDFAQKSNQATQILNNDVLALDQRVENIEKVLEHAFSDLLVKINESITSPAGQAAIEMVARVSSDLPN
jgi:hypothetical protein